MFVLVFVFGFNFVVCRGLGFIVSDMGVFSLFVIRKVLLVFLRVKFVWIGVRNVIWVEVLVDFWGFLGLFGVEFMLFLLFGEFKLGLFGVFEFLLVFNVVVFCIFIIFCRDLIIFCFELFMIKFGDVWNGWFIVYDVSCLFFRLDYWEDMLRFRFVY